MVAEDKALESTGAGFSPLSLQELGTNQPLVCDLYIDERGRYVLYRQASRSFTQEDRRKLLARGVSRLWVRIGGDSRSQEQLGHLLALPDEQVSPATKATMLYTSATSVARQAMVLPPTVQTVSELRELSNLVVYHVTHSPSAFHSLLSVMEHEFSVFSHAVNVAVYALALGRFAGITSSKDLKSMTLGAILHDVGKIAVPKEILNKPGPLNAAEWKIMRQHPTTGIEMLRSAVDLPGEALTVIVQHHERIDGSGYPYGISGDDVHYLSKIVSLVDAYDAMTAPRPYRYANTPYVALSILKQERGKQVDPTLFVKLVGLLGGLPPSQLEEYCPSLS